MNSKLFHYSPTWKPLSVLDSFFGTPYEKKLLKDILMEWNSRISISAMCKSWRKERPIYPSHNLLFLVYNAEGLSTHLTDIDILLNNYRPQICILTEVGAAARNLPCFPGYQGLAQTGSNSFGGVVILYANNIKCKVVERDVNFLVMETIIAGEKLNIGAIYVPPNSPPPFHLFTKYLNKAFIFFGDYNAKHSHWNCPKNNPSGNQLFAWLEHIGVEIISPNKATSRRSDSVIDFGITHDASGWNAEVLEEGTSDHRPILFQSPYSASVGLSFRRTNWNVFSFFLTIVFEYWNSLVYNFDINSFIELFSLFLSALWDRCSVYEKVEKYSPPWPPFLVSLAKEVNKSRRRYRHYKSPGKLEIFLNMKKLFIEKRNEFLQEKREKNLNWMRKNQNMWKYVKPLFHTFAPPFRGLTTDDNSRETRPEVIVEMLANHYEKHFATPNYDIYNPMHIHALEVYDEIASLPELPLEQIKIEEVEREWKKFQPKKSIDSANTSAFLLKKLPIQFISIITTLFNRCAEKGEFFQKAKHAKVICLSKEGLYPTVSKLRPISLLPNIGKWFERIIHNRIVAWCKSNHVYIDEQSGFTTGRRLQTRILSLIEDLRLTVAANNRPALVLFIDFLSAFDKMWYPSLLTNLRTLGLPAPLLKWIFNWLQQRTLSIHFGEVSSRTIPMYVGAPQGSVLAATLFRLHVHFLPSFFFSLTSHMFADDLAIQISGDLDKRFSRNITELEERARWTLERLGKFSDDNILPVNIKKTKALLVHSVVAPSKPNIEFKGQPIEYVNKFKYLGVTITAKLGWGIYISERIRTIRKVYRGMKILFYSIPKSEIKIRKKIFSAFAMPHFIWLFSTWFFYTETQQRQIEHVYCSGIKQVYSLQNWDDETVLILSREQSLLDHLYSYWIRFSIHLELSTDALCFQQTWQAYKIIISPDKSWFRCMGFNKRSFFPNRLRKRVQHTLAEWHAFKNIHQIQRNYYRTSTTLINRFIYKYFLCANEI